MTMLNVCLRRNECQSAESWKWKEIKGEAEARRPGGRVWRKTGSDQGLTGGMCRTTLNGVVVFLGTVQPAHALKEPCAYGQGENGR